MPHGLSSLRPSSLRKRQQCRVFARLRDLSVSVGEPKRTSGAQTP